MRVFTLTRAAGQFNFAPHQKIEIADGPELDELIAAKAVRPLEDKSPATADKPTRRSKQKAAEPEREQKDGASQDG